jgi:hypothetical protein
MTYSNLTECIYERLSRYYEDVEVLNVSVRLSTIFENGLEGQCERTSSRAISPGLNQAIFSAKHGDDRSLLVSP